MSYRNLRFLEYGMTNAIHYKCEFACDCKPKRGNTIDICTLAHTVGPRYNAMVGVHDVRARCK